MKPKAETVFLCIVNSRSQEEPSAVQAGYIMCQQL